MRSVQYISLAGAFAAATVSAGVVTVPFEKRNLSPDVTPSLLRRDGSVSLDAINNLTGGGYYAQFSVGTPPQKLSFLLDTGSSDTWVNSVTADLCTDEITQQEVGEYCFKQCRSHLLIACVACSPTANPLCHCSQPKEE